MRKRGRIGMLAAGMAAVAWTCEARIELNITAHPSPHASHETAGYYVNQKEWALAASAILFEINNQRHDLLGGNFRSEEGVQSCKAMLGAWWDVHSREDLLQTLEWLGTSGHRKEFAETGEMIYSLTPEEIAVCVSHAQDDEELLNQLELVREYYPKLGEKSLLAWDFGRYIALCRWGYFVGYLSEDEAWGKIMPAARMLRQHFSSWKELGENYLIGREYWSYRVTRVNGEEYRHIVRKLIKDPASPWNLCPWNTNMKRSRLVDAQTED